MISALHEIHVHECTHGETCIHAQILIPILAHKQAAESKADVSEKWNKAMKSMEALAAFSRRKVNKQ